MTLVPYVLLYISYKYLLGIAFSTPYNPIFLKFPLYPLLAPAVIVTGVFLLKRTNLPTNGTSAIKSI